MTTGGVLPVVGSFTGGGRPSYVMPDPVITFCLFFKKKGLTNPKKGIIKNM